MQCMAGRKHTLPIENYLTPTVEDLGRRFKEYNEKYFDNQLSPCKFSIRRAKDYYGLYSYRGPEQKPVIYICKYVYWTDEGLRMVLVHEMLHHYIQTVLQPKCLIWPHGFIWNRECRRLKRKYNIDVRNFNSTALYFHREKIAVTRWEKFCRFMNYAFVP